MMGLYVNIIATLVDGLLKGDKRELDQLLGLL